MDDAYIDLFEMLRQTVEGLSLDDFAEADRQGKLMPFAFWNAVAGTPLALVWDQLNNWRSAAANTGMPVSLRNKSLTEIQYKIEEVLGQLRGGAVVIQRRRLGEALIAKLTNPKVRAICLEINTTPDGNVIALSQLLGEALKWSLWHKAKQNGTTLKEDGNLQPLLKEAIDKNYFSGNAPKRFLKDFRDNHMKTSFDMIRHSESYVPDLTVLNPQFDALEAILEECV